MEKYIRRILEDISSLASFVASTVLLLFFIVLGEYKIALFLFGFIVVSTVIISVMRLFIFRKRPNEREYNNWIERIDEARQDQYPESEYWPLF